LPMLAANAEKTATLLPSLPPLEHMLETQTYTPYSPYSPVDSLTLYPDVAASIEDILPRMSNTLKAEFKEDVSIPQNTPLVAQTRFLKAWKMRNNGAVAWPKTTVIKHVGGSGSAHMFDASLTGVGEGDGPEFPVGVVQPGESVNVTAHLQAPAEPGQYCSYWRLNDGAGDFIGPRVVCQIVVQAADETSSLASSSVIFPVLTQTVASSMPASMYQSDIDDLDVDTPAPFREPASLNVTTVLDDDFMTQEAYPAVLEDEFMTQAVAHHPAPKRETGDSDSDSDSDSDTSSFEIIDESDEDDA